jgi:hypothetical protein
VRRRIDIILLEEINFHERELAALLSNEMDSYISGKSTKERKIIRTEEEPN